MTEELKAATERLRSQSKEWSDDYEREQMPYDEARLAQAFLSQEAELAALRVRAVGDNQNKLGANMTNRKLLTYPDRPGDDWTFQNVPNTVTIDGLENHIYHHGTWERPYTDAEVNAMSKDKEPTTTTATLGNESRGDLLIKVVRLENIIDRINALHLPHCNSGTNPATHELAYKTLVITGERTPCS